MMTLYEFQYLQLEIAREVGAERGFHVQLAEQEDLHDAGFETKPMGMRRWGFFRRRPRLRQIAVAFYKPDDKTQPSCIYTSYFDMNDLDKLNPSAYRRTIEARMRSSVEEAETIRRRRGFE